MDQLRETIWMLISEADGYSSATRGWMMVMASTFLLSILLSPFRVSARWILAAFLVNMVGIISIKLVHPELSRLQIGTVIHLLFWPIVLFMIWKRGNRKDQQFTGGLFQRSYAVWLLLASGVLVISLAFDLRAAISWVT